MKAAAQAGARPAAHRCAWRHNERSRRNSISHRQTTSSDILVLERILVLVAVGTQYFLSYLDRIRHIQLVLVLVLMQKI